MPISRINIYLVVVSLLMVYAVAAVGAPASPSNSCRSCHQGLAPIRPRQSAMFRNIAKIATLSKTHNRCIVCHGGNPKVRVSQKLAVGSPKYQQLARQAHQGTIAYFQKHGGPQTFYPDPGSPWINAHTCGPCHAWQVKAQWRSLMMTEAGKIQGAAWGFGGLCGYEHQWANYTVRNPSQKEEHYGTAAYQQYMQRLRQAAPNVLVNHMQAVPAAPQGAQDVTHDPRQAAFTYIRGECQRCHLGVGGKQRYGDYRARGCSACHIPYSNHGRYEGQDQSIDKTRPGHPLVHSIQATANSPVKLHGLSYCGIPAESCTTCHNRGRRIGVSFQGLMETPYVSPWRQDGRAQQKLHGKYYLQLPKDHHYAKGFLCQDCHTSLDVHSSNQLAGSISAAVEIECYDCHGTPQKYPWELPLGFGDEYSETPEYGPARGLAQSLPAYMRQGHTPPVADGYLLSARGNPLGNVVKAGDKIKVYLVSGEVKELTPLKAQTQKQVFNLAGRVAMVQVGKHMQRLECYTCHATWAPQCYGCHLKIDYHAPQCTYDWVQLGHAHQVNGLTPEYSPAGESYKIRGHIVETRSYLRWENPPLGQNGEGRIAPLVPGCQTTVTVINQDGHVVLRNHIFLIKDVEGAGAEGQRALDMSPLYPHTPQPQARTCESCHANPQALGYGIQGGQLYAKPSQPYYIDLMTPQGQIISNLAKPQIAAIPNLHGDWSQFLTPQGRQTQTVGHHFKLSRPLNNSEREHLQRQGVCLACHQEIPKRSLAVNLLHHLAAVAGMLPKTTAQHNDLLHKSLLLAGWCQILGGLAVFVASLGAIYWLYRRYRQRTSTPTS